MTTLVVPSPTSSSCGGELHKHLGSRVLHLKQLEDGGAIVGDCHVPNVVHHHLVKTHWAKAALHNVCNGRGCHHILRSHILSSGSVTPESERRLDSAHGCSLVEVNQAIKA